LVEVHNVECIAIKGFIFLSKHYELMNNIRSTIIVDVVFDGIAKAFFIRGRSDKYAVMGEDKIVQFSNNFTSKLENKKENSED